MAVESSNQAPPSPTRRRCTRQLLDVRSQLRKHQPRRLNLRRQKNLAWDVLQTRPLYPRLLV
jgi:hypothetical protein